MQLTTLKASSRKNGPSLDTRRLRCSGQVPGIYYGKGLQPISLAVNALDLRSLLAPGKRYTLLNLEIDGKAGFPAIIHDYQKDPISAEITHLDFLHISEERSVKVRIPVILEGVAIGVKGEGGMLSQVTRSIQISCQPSKIPTEFRVDISEMKSGTTFYAKQVNIGDAKLVANPQVVIFTISKGRAAAAAEVAEPAKDAKKK